MKICYNNPDSNPDICINGLQQAKRCQTLPQKGVINPWFVPNVKKEPQLFF